MMASYCLCVSLFLLSWPIATWCAGAGSDLQVRGGHDLSVRVGEVVSADGGSLYVLRNRVRHIGTSSPTLLSGLVTSPTATGRRSRQYTECIRSMKYLCSDCNAHDVVAECGDPVLNERVSRVKPAESVGSGFTLSNIVGKGHQGEVWRASRVDPLTGDIEEDGPSYVLKRLFSHSRAAFLSGWREVHFGQLFLAASCAGTTQPVTQDDDSLMQGGRASDSGQEPEDDWTAQQGQSRATGRRRMDVDCAQAGTSWSSDRVRNAVGSVDFAARYVEHFFRNSTITRKAFAGNGDTARLNVTVPIVELWIVFRDEGLSLQRLLYEASPSSSAPGTGTGGGAATAPGPFWLRLQSMPPGVGAQVVQQLTGQMLQGLVQLHDHARLLAHRDIKPGNILLGMAAGANAQGSSSQHSAFSTGASHLDVRYADFGSAVDEDSVIALYPSYEDEGGQDEREDGAKAEASGQGASQEGLETDPAGGSSPGPRAQPGPSIREATLAYAPPEVIFSRDGSPYAPHVPASYDSWSLGLTILETVAGMPPTQLLGLSNILGSRLAARVTARIHASVTHHASSPSSSSSSHEEEQASSWALTSTQAALQLAALMALGICPPLSTTEHSWSSGSHTWPAVYGSVYRALQEAEASSTAHSSMHHHNHGHGGKGGVSGDDGVPDWTFGCDQSSFTRVIRYWAWQAHVRAMSAVGDSRASDDSMAQDDGREPVLDVQTEDFTASHALSGLAAPIKESGLALQRTGTGISAMEDTERALVTQLTERALALSQSLVAVDASDAASLAFAGALVSEHGVVTVSSTSERGMQAEGWALPAPGREAHSRQTTLPSPPQQSSSDEGADSHDIGASTKEGPSLLSPALQNVLWKLLAWSPEERATASQALELLSAGP